MTHLAPGPIGGHLPRAEKPAPYRVVRFTGPDKPEREPDWRDRGACANSPDPDRWFPAGNTGVWLAQIEEAKAACRTCPVLANCAELLETMQQDLGDNLEGIWAGTSQEDRTGDRMREKRRLAKARYAEKQRAAA